MTSDALFYSIYEALCKGIQTRRHAYNFACLATSNGDQPQQRMVVLRSISDNCIRIYTDPRTPKVAQLRENPKANILVYDTEAMVQISLNGTIAICEDEDQAVWNSVHTRSYRDYTAVATPGSAVTSPEAVAYDHTQAHFCYLEFRFEKIDYLSIGQPHNTRIQASYVQGAWKAGYVVP